ncbi:MAG: 3-hydroxyacyl-CoA dehydrogenase/enoyl-CoA hydratase family protein [Flavobacteriales bacterium]|nr:3-hydroxyacyl-CoA dehydrogenase/enoyl-CoA hydratase family protein [Flavobacteriales bacterium]
MSKRRIQKVAVLGSGIMGSRIACHFANVGVQVLLLDIVPKELSETEVAKGLSLEDAQVRNRIVNDSLKSAIKSSPSPLYQSGVPSLITTGNFDDDLEKVSEYDWILEAIIERLDIKKDLFEKLDGIRKEGTLITSNTSGIPIHLMSEGRSEDFRKHFCGTHFFNPPRYLELLEIIPGPDTSSEVLDFHMDYGKRFLGKSTVLCKDTPAFIANRIGVFNIMWMFHYIKENGWTVDEIDRLTGPLIGRAKSATFRTTDVVGLDTLIHVANGLSDNVPNDEAKELFKVPDYVSQMASNNMLGSKTKQGFFKKIKNDEGKSEILTLNLDTLEYGPRQKPNLPSIEAIKADDNLESRLKSLFNLNDRVGQFFKDHFLAMVQYASNRVPEISDEVYRVDDALKAGFSFKLGPFESWDAIGFHEILALAKERKLDLPVWVSKMVEAKAESFYKIEKGKRLYWDIRTNAYLEIPGQEGQGSLAIARSNGIVWENSGSVITDLGDGILNIEFTTKMNTIGGDVLSGINKAIELAEESYEGLLVSNSGDLFSAGANAGLILMMAAEQDYEELDLAIRQFQNTMMRIRYSGIPVVAAPHNMALGGGCELCLHADSVVAHAELYIGLVEFGIGVIPAGGGTKEFAVRLSDELSEGGIRTNQFRNRLMTIAQAKVSTSAYEAFELGYLRKGIDEVVVNRSMQLTVAKNKALQLAKKGYTEPVERKDIEVMGNEGLGLVFVGAETMVSGHYMSEHDRVISEKLGWVLCGGDLSYPQQVSEQYLLDLERKAFIELCGTRKTLERLQSIVKSGKVLRN